MVSVIYRAPWWFFGVDGAFGLVAAIVALLILLFSYKAFKITHEKKYIGFGLAFLFFVLAFGVKAVTDLSAYFNVTEPAVAVKSFFGVSNAFISGYLTFLFFSLLAYVVLVAIAFKLKDKRLVVMLFLITLPAVVLSNNYFITFHLLSSIFLAFVALSFYNNYASKKSATSLLVFVAFLLMFLAQVQSLIGLRSDSYYITGRATELLGFILLFIALLTAIRK